MHLLATRPAVLLPRILCRRCRRSLTSAAGSRVFAEGDVVLLRNRANTRSPGILTKPLKSGVDIQNHHGRIQHDDIIGKSIRDIIQTKSTSYRIHEPTLDEYVRMTPRIVTPIYPNDASFIVNLLDIHVGPEALSAAQSPPLEILEAGTGHGGLTLHLARAIHGANPPLPEFLRYEHASTDPVHADEDVTYESTTTDHAAEPTIEAWKKKRRAVVHTLDNKSRHSKHARKTVKGFRRGMYANDVDFHVDDVSFWVKARFAAQASGDSAKDPEPFLSRIFLDLPSAETHLELLAKALHVDGVLAVFNPSISQIAECVQKVKELNLPFALETVVELKGSDTVREWDVRVSQLKAARKEANGTDPKTEDGESPEVDQGSIAESSEKETSLAEQAVEEAEELQKLERQQEEQLAASEADSWKLICRPKTGLTMGVGGFVGLWRRQKTP